MAEYAEKLSARLRSRSNTDLLARMGTPQPCSLDSLRKYWVERMRDFLPFLDDTSGAGVLLLLLHGRTTAKEERKLDLGTLRLDIRRQLIERPSWVWSQLLEVCHTYTCRSTT